MVALSRKKPAGYPEISFLSFDVLELLTSIQHEMGLLGEGPITFSLQTTEMLAYIYCATGEQSAGIYLHSLFNRADVPQPVIEHLLRHELLHIKVPPRIIDGKLVFHPPEYWEAESQLVPWKAASWAWIYTAFWDALKVDRENECVWVNKNWKRLQRNPYPSWQMVLDDIKRFGKHEDDIKALMQGI